MMNTARRWKQWIFSALLILISMSMGCQSWGTGMTLPSASDPHPPQYFPESPPFPLEWELTSIDPSQPIEPREPVAP